MPVLRQILVEEDDHPQAGEAFNDSPEPSGRLVHHQLDIEEDQAGTRSSDEAQCVAQCSGLTNDGSSAAPIENATKSLSEVCTPIRYHGCDQSFVRYRCLRIHISLNSYDDRAEWPCLWGRQ